MQYADLLRNYELSLVLSILLPWVEKMDGQVDLFSFRC
jgi:hypothetical protein